jgi:competence protein ComEC
VENNFLSVKILVLSSFLSFLIILFAYISFANKFKTVVVFCNVGQGDATYIRVKNKIDILIDAGPNNAVLNCLGKYMPFYDREIEIALMSHPQKDHIGGFLPVLQRYRVDKFIMTKIDNPINLFSQLKTIIKMKNIPVLFANSDLKFNISGDSFEILWPTERFINENKQSSLDLNYFSIIAVFKENTFRVLFTGDVPPQILNRLLNQSDLESTILKVPHHGSKNGLTAAFLKLADPKVSVISVGKNNSYGHPSKEILEMLKTSKTWIRRTDLEGDIVIKIPNLNDQ